MERERGDRILKGAWQLIHAHSLNAGS